MNITPGGGVPPDIPASKNQTCQISDMEISVNSEEEPGNDGGDVSKTQIEKLPFVREATGKSTSNFSQRSYQEAEDNVNKRDQQQSQGKEDYQGNEPPKLRSSVKYSRDDTGPFSVFIENISKNFTGHLNAVKVGGFLLTKWPSFDNKIDEIKSIGKNRVKVVFKDYATANALVTLSTILQSENLEAYIPKFLTCRKGVIRFISREYSNQYLKENIRPNNFHSRFEIDSVERIERKVVENGNETYIPTESIIVYFRGQVLPKHVIINKVRCEVELYVQRVLLCFNCFRYGHMAKQCKSSSRCVKCGKGHGRDLPCNLENLSLDDSSPKCLQCGGAHLATQLRMCPEFSRQKQIKTAMSQTNSSFREVAQTISRSSYASKVRQGKPTQTAESHSAVDHARQPYPHTRQQSSPVVKRARPSSPQPNVTLQEHANIISNISLPKTPGGILSHPTCNGPPKNNNLPGEGGNNHKDDVLVKTVFEVVKIILDLFKSNSNYEAQSNEILELVRDKLSVHSLLSETNE